MKKKNEVCREQVDSWERAWTDTWRKKQASLYRLIGTSTLLVYSGNKIPAKIIVSSHLPDCDV